MGSRFRRSPRYPFYASAEIVEQKTQTRMTTRTSELSRHGCYFDMLNPLPLGTAVKIEILYNEQTFGATGHVIYSQHNMGMGVAFGDIEPPQQQMLEKWLNHLRGG
jgi:PilZ domain